MKYISKWMICLSFILSLTLSSCAADNMNRESTFPTLQPSEIPLNSSQPSGLPITDNLQSIDIFFPRIEYYHPSDHHMDLWYNATREKYNLNINLHYTKLPVIINDKDYSSIDGDLYNDLIEISDLDGFVYINDISLLTDLIKSGIVKPVTDILPNIPCIQDVDKNVINYVSDGNSKIWAIPLTDRIIYNARTYSKSWLETLGFPVPEDIDDFYEYAKAVAKNDPDKNGLADSYISLSSLNDILFSFQDIFRAFGCYTTDNYPISYNPSIKKFELIAMNNGFLECISFLKLMRDEQLIRILVSDNDSFHDNSTAALEYKPGSMFGKTNGLMSFQGEVSFGPYLKGNNTQNLVEARPVVSYFAMLADSDEKSSTLSFNAFAESVMDMPDSYYDFREGAPDYKYFDRGEYIDIQTKDDSGNTILSLGILIGYINSTTEIKPAVFDGNINQLKIMEEENIHALAAEAELDINDIQKNSYSIPLSAQSTDLFELNIIVQNMTIQLFADIFQNNIEPEDAIESYINSIDDLGILDSLAELNNKLSTPIE